MSNVVCIYNSYNVHAPMDSMFVLVLGNTLGHKRGHTLGNYLR